ncbi:putative cellobiose ABC transporter permease protein [Actinoplanes missouriensis 431]|uniref:Putative cellobiose ABC transporter permease protein n=1 Tax=Actinoplanes missouriensis (strain ATCC 14538 / DSM 43046 / CBS 188.64 / JCM 3121 / NBRC 102363 / NCIMB 12654 / NRRL B-3342 / UNCC 431) TaxID=512565 RepID=I0HH59_ACTM4|nr:carbohydrate ABC transporter permease [Actinoplanes missouriensis]BAL92346.1 putative cellobiose ABC transporter permease protein [Actinoplanes missouriensis 431]
MTTLVNRAPQETRGNWKTYAALAAFMVISAFPVYWMFVIATSTDEKVMGFPPTVIPGDQLLVNLGEVFGMQNVYFTASLINSVIVAGVVTATTLFFCSLAGFAFAKLRFRYRNALMFVVILTLTVPNQLGVVALYILMARLDWNGTLLAVIAPGLVTAFGVFYMRQFISHAIPDELIEAARIDGALTLRIYWTVVLPAIRPALAVLGLLTFVATWNDFQWPLITLGGTDFPTSMVALSDLASGNYVIYRRVLAGAFAATVPLVILLLIGGRQIVRGIMEGALK